MIIGSERPVRATQMTIVRTSRGRFHSRALAVFVSCTVLMAPCSTNANSIRSVAPLGRNVPKLINADAFMRANTPRTAPPNKIPAPPMAQTRKIPASAMNRRAPQVQIGGLAWSQIPGSAQFVAGSPDGSLWAVSTSSPSPGGNGIWHYAGGTWTNIGGAATRLSVGPDGSLWAINSFGGIYHLKNGAWTQIAGGASDISVGPDGIVYIVSSLPGNLYGNAIYRYVNGGWQQLPGAAVHIAASWDINSYANGIKPGGFYLTNSQGSIFYCNPPSGYVALPGAAAQLAPAFGGGLFALGFPESPSGDPIYYDDISTGNWSPQSGAGSSIATTAYNVYVTSAAGGIYSAPVVPAISGGPLTGPSLGPDDGWGPPAVANALQFPVQSGFDGSGSTVAIVMSSSVYASDVLGYLDYFQIPRTSRAIDFELINGASATPNSDGDTEASLDVETVAGLAPGANIILYVLPTLSDQNIVDGYNAVVSDGVARVASSSFGGCESNGAKTGMGSVIAAGAANGIAFVASSGDQGSACYIGNDAQGNPLYETGVNYPASDPNVIGVGGTETQPPANLTSNVVWNDDYSANGQEAGGGGVSTLFSLPPYQSGLLGTISTQNRNVPDVSMPANNDDIAVGGMFALVNGTSWGAPQFAAMLAEIYEYCGTPFPGGAAIPYFVKAQASYNAFIDVVSGNNQFFLSNGSTPAYAAGPGYDNASGIGTPLGMPFAQALCPNRVPAVRAHFQPSVKNTTSVRVGLPAVVSVTPRVRGVIDFGHKTGAEPMRVQLVLDSRNSLASEEQAVVKILRAAGFSIVQTFKNHLVVDATSSTGNVEQFFRTRIDNVWQHRPRAAYMPVAPVTIPASLAGLVAGISLDSVETMAFPRPLARRR